MRSAAGEDAREARGRLERYARELKTQNEQLREQVSDAPAAPTLDEDDETTRAIGEARAAIEVARRHMRDLPAIVREALFQQYHDARPLTVGGFQDTFTTDVARQNVEQGYLTWVEDSEQTVYASNRSADGRRRGLLSQELARGGVRGRIVGLPSGGTHLDPSVSKG